MSIALKINTTTGNVEQFGTGDTLQVDSVVRRGTGHLTIGSDLAADDDELRLGAAGFNTRVMGNLIVDGEVTAIHKEDLRVEANYIILNDGYTADTAVTAGFVFNYDPTTTADTVGTGGFTAGIPATSNPTVVTAGSGTFAANDIVLITNAADEFNNGFYEVLTHVSTLLTLRGIGLTATLQAFSRNQVNADATVQGAITKCNVTVLRCGTDGVMEIGNGSTNAFTYSDIGSSSNTLQQTYVLGNTIDVTSGEGAIDFENSTNSDTTTVLSVHREPSSSTAGIGIDVLLNANTTGAALKVNQLGSGNALQVQDGSADVLLVTGAGAITATPTSGQNFSVTTAGAGDVVLNSADVVDIDSGGAMTLDSAAGISIDAATASNFSCAAGNLTFDAAAGELVLDDVGSWAGTLSQASFRTLDQTGSGEVLNGATSLIGAINKFATRADVTPEIIAEIPIANGAVISAGDCVAQTTTSGRVQRADGNGNGQGRFIGIAKAGGTGDAGGTVLARVWLPGSLVTDGGASFTAGGALFIPDGTGRPTGTAPSGTGDLVQRVAWAETSTTYRLEPSTPVVL